MTMINALIVEDEKLARDLIRDYLRDHPDIKLMGEFEDAVTVFIEPPNMAELKRRLESRGTESQENMERRLSNAQKELEYRDRFKYILTNDKVDSSVEKLERIIDQELQKRR